MGRKLEKTKALTRLQAWKSENRPGGAKRQGGNMGKGYYSDLI